MVKQLLKNFVPAPNPATWVERGRATVSAFVGLLLTYAISRYCLGPSSELPILIAPMGASSVLVFCVPASPMAQPWPVLAGNVVSALIAITCLKTIPDPAVAAPLALALAIAAMFPLRCLHPPGGAVALTTVLGGHAVAAAGYDFALAPVGLNSLILIVMAIVLNNGLRRPYPHPQQAPHVNVHGSKDPPPAERVGISQADIDAVLAHYGQFLDVSRDDFEDLIAQTEMLTYRRRFGTITCGDIMTRDVFFIAPETSLLDAWNLIRDHDVWALPVVDASTRVIGLVGRENFFGNRRLDTSEQDETAARIMNPSTVTIANDRPFIELVPLMTDTGQRHIPVVDENRRLVGIVSQSDLIAALYRNDIVKALNFT